MGIDTVGVRIYGKNDLRLERFTLPEPADDEIVAKIVSNSICMSSHKAAEQGASHKRVPDDVAEDPTIIGHEFAGRILKVGSKWADQFEEGQKFALQPALMYKGSLDAPGYSYRQIGGNCQKIIIPQEVMTTGSLLPYSGDAYFKASLSEPMSCVVAAFMADYHIPPAQHGHVMGIKEGGNAALLASAGPMGLGAIDFALHGPKQPGVLLVTDIDPDRLGRARSIFPPEKAAQHGVELVHLNPNDLDGGNDALVDYVRELTDGEMMDDVFVFFPHPALIEQADELLGRDGCLNFFAGPKDRDFKASINFYDVHYEGHHLAGTSGGTTEDMQMSLDLMSAGRLNPAHMITHVGGLDSAVDTILDLPNIPGGKKLVYVDLSMPMTPIDEFDEHADEADEPLKSVYRELGRLVDRAGGLWNKEAEEFLLSCDEVKYTG